MIGCDVDSPHQQIPVYNPVKEIHRRADNPFRRGSRPVKIGAPMSLFRNLPSVLVRCDGAAIFFPAFFVRQIFDVVSDCQNNLVGRQSLVNHVQNERVRHFAGDAFRFLKIIRALQNLSSAQTVSLRFVRFNVGDSHTFPPPRVVDNQLCAYAEHLIEKFLVVIIRRFPNGTSRNVPHCVQALFLQLLRVSLANSPEVRQRPVRPEAAAVGHLIQFRNPNAVPVGRDAFGPNI